MIPSVLTIKYTENQNSGCTKRLCHGYQVKLNANCTDTEGQKFCCLFNKPTKVSYYQNAASDSTSQNL
jgi:hypothetical protein